MTINGHIAKANINKESDMAASMLKDPRYREYISEARPTGYAIYKFSCTGLDGKVYNDSKVYKACTLPSEKLAADARYIALYNGFSGNEVRVYCDGILVQIVQR